MAAPAEQQLMPRRQVAWWNPNYWLFPAQAVTLASVAVFAGSFAWFWRNDINRHLFRFQFPASLLGWGVALLAFLYWLALSRRPFAGYTLFWVQGLVVGAGVLLWLSDDGVLPRGNPLFHAAFAAEGMALIALAPRLFRASPMAPWLKWIGAASFVFSLTASGLIASKLEKKVISDARTRIEDLADRIDRIATALKDARGEMTEPAVEAAEKAALELDNAKFWPLDQFDLESARLLDRADASGSLVTRIANSLDHLTKEVHFSMQIPRFGQDSPTLRFLSVAGKIGRKVEGSADFYQKQPGFEDSATFMKTLPAANKQFAVWYAKDLVWRWAPAAVESSWDSFRPGGGFFDGAFFRPSLRTQLALLQIDKWMALTYSPSKRCGNAEPRKYSKTVTRADPDMAGQTKQVLLSYTLETATCTSFWSFDEGKTLEKAALLKTVRIAYCKEDESGLPCRREEDPPREVRRIELSLDSRSLSGDSAPGDWLRGLVQILESKLPASWSISQTGPGGANLRSTRESMRLSATRQDRFIVVSVEREVDPWLADAHQAGVVP